MKERPILFSAPMVKALLAGTKTMTRRVVKPQPDIVANNGALAAVFTPDDEKLGRLGRSIPCPYGQPGDRLWVRESCRAEELPSGLDGVRYLADGAFREIENTSEASDKWLTMHAYRGKRGATVPPIHMTRWASRILLEITDVRVERLNDISETDAIAEGIEQNDDGYWRGTSPPSHNTAIEAYRDLWENINWYGSWAANPWVWVVEFRRVTP